MNIVNAIQRREGGFESIHNYDIALSRLKCYHDDVYYGITPNINAADFNPAPPVFACRFCTTPGYEEIIALANEDGKIALQDTRIKGKNDELLEGTQAHCNAIFDLAWMPGELKLITASGDHTARLWDVSRSEIEQIDCFHAHTRSVKTAVFRYQDKAVFATGARDGSIMIWDIRANHTDQRKPDNCIANAHSVGNTNNRRRKASNQISRMQSITGLVFQDDFTLISCAAGDGLIKVWDLRKNYAVHKKEPIAKHLINFTGTGIKNGFSSLLICPARITLYASCMDSTIYAYNISSYNRKPVAKYHGHQNFTYYVKTCLSSDGRYLASGSSNNYAYIWRTNKPGGPLVKLYGHTQEVTCIAWCNIGETKIVTCSDDSRHRIWRVGFEHKVENEEITIRGSAKFADNINLNLKLISTSPSSITNREVALHSSITPGVTTPEPTSEDIMPEPSNKDAMPEPTNKDAMPESSNEDDISYYKANTSKRSHLQMMTGSRLEEKYKSILSPIYENYETIAKRTCTDNHDMRRLFNAETITSTSIDYDSDERSIGQSAYTNKDDGILFSPTSNLPNFVIDGTAPHLLEISPQKYKENVDWLTKMRKERYEQRKATLNSSSPQNQTTPSRRMNKLRSTESQRVIKTIKGTSLLNFFKTINKDREKSPRSENSNVIPSTSIS